ncbi:cupin domain-containing protein [Gilvimarinus polysaccharolyticus]|uniref:hypothetical protein n=1 Tax=Gilvimarinus polysaccharolyticus TaxID=863921 RepID=UPI0006736878|nr:hypothetical protein [Gilvimarinus polysaccharolyticus]
MSFHFFMAQTASCSHLTRGCSPDLAAIDVPGWQVQLVEDAGVSLLVLTADTNAEYFPPHASPDNWLALVVQGEARLFSGDETEIADGVDCSPGDFISFGANTYHSWELLEGPLKIVLSKVAG